MYISRLTLLSDADPRQIARLNGYREHQVIWNIFDKNPDASRDFLFRREGKPEAPVYYVVSQRKPVTDQQLWKIDTKDYAPKLSKGRHLTFKLRVNPIITRSSNGKQNRIDLVMDQQVRLGWKSLTANERPPLQRLVQQAGEQWMDKRQNKLGIKIITLSADGYLRHRSHKPQASKPLIYSTIDLQGVITVTNENALLAALFQGVGAAKAMGCGLMLVKPM